jgi:hypothetical protein
MIQRRSGELGMKIKIGWPAVTLLLGSEHARANGANIAQAFFAV